ncbi:MAG TPA: hypothetical protein PKL84_08250 [Candidatus Hydrogenedentes bacterium]|nr:hypothetical protein [Candidatus Hydrogenedentota bacterium]
MTHLLRQAFEKAESLPEAEQDALGRWLLEDVASEERWRQLFEESEGLLAEMAREARAEYRDGDTLPLNPDAL